MNGERDASGHIIAAVSEDAVAKLTRILRTLYAILGTIVIAVAGGSAWVSTVSYRLDSLERSVVAIETQLSQDYLLRLRALSDRIIALEAEHRSEHASAERYEKEKHR